MSRIHRAFLENLPEPGQRLDLDGQEAHHLGRVLRVRPGERVILFNGAGRALSAQVERVSKRVVELIVGDPEPNQPPPRVRLRLAVGLPDRKRAQRMVEALAELGVERLVPLRSERSSEPLPGDVLRRWALESAKQSGRNTLLTIEDPVALGELSLSEHEEGWVADPEASPWLGTRLASPPPAAACVAVGPPGGFSPAERDELVARGFTALRLAPLVLRVETAAVAAAASVVAGWPPEGAHAPDA